MEEEARELLTIGVRAKRMAQTNLADSIRRRIAPLGGVELAPLNREAIRRPPQLAK
jgi:hypothetical protein